MDDATTETRTPNVELFRATVRQILTHPELHDQAEFDKPGTCGTTFCFAGWAAQLSGKVYYNPADLLFRDTETDEIVLIDARSQELLGITEAQAWDRVGDPVYRHPGLFSPAQSLGMLLDKVREIIEPYGGTIDDIVAELRPNPALR